MTAVETDLALLAELDRAHGAVREELARANTVALGVAGTVATLAAVGLAALMAGQWTPARLPAAGQAGWWTAVLAAVAGVGLLAAAVLPALVPDGPGRPAPVSWVSISRYKDMDELAAALAGLALDPTPRVAHLRLLAGLAARKWRRIRYGLLALAAAGGLLLVLALGTAVTR